ncbi:MAG: hypothetical protein KatS3mg044_1388 [Rhodothermaceae bacterium]|nr:MAG: hypothetical protein D6746_01980 [Bacteroidota bacterium]GIV62522.1 MAG: hypothetical protein KatS3mg044_1388 [Rhodothermaceae bacterium]
MSNFAQNIVVLVVCWLLVTGAGIYVTYFDQPEDLERLEKAEKVSRMKQAELTALMAEEASTAEQAEEILRRWNARYKIIPRELDDEEVVAYLNYLSRDGFENFDITFSGEKGSKDFNKYVYQVSGRGYFDRLYRVVWELENNRYFFRVRNLNLEHIDLVSKDPRTQREALKVMVSFTMTVEAYFGGAEGLSADTEQTGAESRRALSEGLFTELPPVPMEVLPAREPAKNPFFPGILETIPPNTDNLVDVEEARLVSIVAGRAIFDWNGEYHQLDVGDRVYLGKIIEIDPTQDRVVARLNKGGIIDEIELELQTGERYRQALGPASLTPVQKQ